MRPLEAKQRSQVMNLGLSTGKLVTWCRQILLANSSNWLAMAALGFLPALWVCYVLHDKEDCEGLLSVLRHMG